MGKASVKVIPRRCVGRRERGQGETKAQLEGAPPITKCYINFKSQMEILFEKADPREQAGVLNKGDKQFSLKRGRLRGDATCFTLI